MLCLFSTCDRPIACTYLMGVGIICPPYGKGGQMDSLQDGAGIGEEGAPQQQNAQQVAGG